LLPVLVLGVAAAAWWLLCKPPTVFVVRVRGGQPEATRGKVTDALRLAVADVFREFGLQKGEIRGVARGRRIALWFSSGLPPEAGQRLRNWWALSGWLAQPERGCEREMKGPA
jgi:hypothetical protein